MTKAELYRFVEEKRRELGVSELPVYVPSLVRDRYPDIVLTETDFGTRLVGGMLFRGPVSLLSLNTRRNEVERNFDCAHELLHYWSDLHHCALTPDTSPAAAQNPYIEWVANEGAAELLMPMRCVLPLFYHERLWRCAAASQRQRLTALAEGFIVTPAQMENRYRSLREELRQYTMTLSCRGIVPAARGYRSSP